MVDFPELLKLMADQGVSDLYLTVGAPPYIKVRGVAQPLDMPAFTTGDVKAMAYSVMTDQQQSRFETALEANLSLPVEGIGRYRINVYIQRGEVAMVVRLLKSNIPAFEQLGLPPQAAELAMLKSGLVLVVGAAGSGKSSTLAAMVDYRARNASGHILTIEDPIEFLFRHRQALVDQREVGVDTLSISDALRNALRERPDVIMIGEIRDLETAQHALVYAETGHLCLSTLHANDAPQAIERLINFFPEQAHKQRLMDLSLNLMGIIAQRLIPSTDGHQALAVEILLWSAEVAELIRAGRFDELKAVMANASDVPMQALDQSLLELYQAGRISQEEALSNANSAADLEPQLRVAARQRSAASISSIGPRK